MRDILDRARTNIQPVFTLLVAWLIGLILNTGTVLIGWSLLFIGEIVTAEPTMSGALALGAVLFILRNMFSATTEKK